MSPITTALDAFRPGRTIFLPGATGESAALIDALSAAPDRLARVRLLGCFVPGMNMFDYAGLHAEARLTTFMLPSAMQASHAAGRIALVPRTYAGAAEMLAAAEVDVAFAHVAPPDADGLCSLGIASDFAPLVWPRATRRILIVNAAMPPMPRGPRLAIADADLVVTGDAPLVTLAAATPSAEADSIARIVVDLIPDGARIQTGIGGAPGAIWPHLRARRGLVLRSGMANEGLRDLAEAGALARDGHRAGIAYGSRDFYDYLARSDLVAFATTRETHTAAALAGIPRFHAVNSALEVDLFGQVNVEWQGGRLASGVGGGADFARAALASPGGRSIIALPATAKQGAVSRIVPRLGAATVSLARTDIDTVVTEHGAARVRDLGLEARAEALIAIAAPAFRPALVEAWDAMRRTF